MKRFSRKLIALIAACAMVFTITFPALASEEITPGEYEMTYVRFYVPDPGTEIGTEGSSRLYGPDVSSNGTIEMHSNRNYTFYYEQILPYGVVPSYGFRTQLQIGSYELTGRQNYVIPVDGKTQFAIPTDGADISVKISFDNVTYNSWMKADESGDIYGPTIELNGKISIEVTTLVDGVFTIPESPVPYTIDNIYEYESDIIADLESGAASVLSGSGNGTMFDEPQELTYRIDLDGQMVGYGTDDYTQSLVIGFWVIGDHDYHVNFQGEQYSTIVRRNIVGEIGVNGGAFSMNCSLVVCPEAWRLTPKSMGADSEDDDITLAKAATVTVGAGAAALGGSALISVIGEAVGSSASNLLTPNLLDPGMIDPAVSPVANDTTLPQSDLPETDVPSSKKKRLFDEDENHMKDDDSNGDSGSDDNTDLPDFPEEDSPEVSMSLYAPGSDLLNIKGGAADLTINVEGGEGYTWNYLPAIIAPGAAKAIIPLVTGRTNLATLALNLTGAATEERHHTIFVNVIAWTTTPSGKILKASASKEMKLHTPGIEAKRDAEGNITVTAYSDTTLKGYAEIRKLSAEEYILEIMEDDSVTIHANDVKLGTTLLKK